MSRASVRRNAVAVAIALTTLGLATPATAEPKHQPPDPTLGRCPTGWQLWWVPEHMGWFAYTINHYEGKDHNGNGVLCRKIVAGKGVQDEHHEMVWVTKDDAKYRP